MGTTIRNLPDELLVEMLGKLLKKDLKSARLVCTLWSTAAAKWMFQRVYFAPRKTSMKLFTDIAANPAFARNVKELIYDGRLFLSELGTFSSYYSAFHARMLEEANICGYYLRNCLFVDEANFADDLYQDSMWNMETLGAGHRMKRGCASDFQGHYAIVANSLVRYARLLEQQESIFAKGKDLKALNEGLSSFRNITKVSAVVDFDHSLEYDLHAGDRHEQCNHYHQWYCSRSNLDCGLTVPPSRWRRRPRHQNGGQQNREQHIKWDIRGVHNLFRAISAHCPSLKTLCIGSMHYKAPMTIFQLSDNDIENIAIVARGLTTLSIYPYVTDSGDDDSEQHHCLGRLLYEAWKLRSLSSSSLSRWSFDYKRSVRSGFEKTDLLVFDIIGFALYNGTQWPHLTQLTLRGACVEARDLISILWVYKESLRELSLGDIAFLGEDGWVGFGQETGWFLKLHFVSICRLYNEGLWVPCHAWSRGEQGFVFIREIMQWAHPDDLEIEQNCGTFTGRLKASLKTDC